MSHTVVSTTKTSATLRGARRAGTCAVPLAGLADWLIYEEPLGISVILFLALFGIIVRVANPAGISRKTVLVATGILATSLLPAFVYLSLVSGLIGLVGFCIYSLLLAGHRDASPLRSLRMIMWLPTSGPFLLFREARSLRRLAMRTVTGSKTKSALLSLSISLIMAGTFLWLFQSANPVIERWLAEIDTLMFRPGSLTRPLFWVCVIAACWSFLRLRQVLGARLPGQATAWIAETAAENAVNHLFGPESVFYSLLLFNALFAVQSALDILYLWGETELPAGVTYASYARQGTYPLLFAALLAGAFILLALRPGGATEATPSVRALVYVWMGQNVLLVVSSVMRLALYVEAYSLTELRVAAFVWMLLVAAGLMTIVLRVALGRSNAWLIAVNMGLVAVTLYISTFVNFPYVIARYNIEHSSAFTGQGSELDTGYLCRLGPYALEAVNDTFGIRETDPLTIERYDETQGYVAARSARNLERCLAAKVDLHRDRMANWRAWSVRDWRFSQFLQERGL